MFDERSAMLGLRLPSRERWTVHDQTPVPAFFLDGGAGSPSAMDFARLRRMVSTIVTLIPNSQAISAIVRWPSSSSATRRIRSALKRRRSSGSARFQRCNTASRRCIAASCHSSLCNACRLSRCACRISRCACRLSCSACSLSCSSRFSRSCSACRLSCSSCRSRCACRLSCTCCSSCDARLRAATNLSRLWRMLSTIVMLIPSSQAIFATVR